MDILGQVGEGLGSMLLGARRAGRARQSARAIVEVLAGEDDGDKEPEGCRQPHEFHIH